MAPSPPSNTTATSEIAAGAMISLLTLLDQTVAPVILSAMISALLVPTTIRLPDAATPPGYDASRYAQLFGTGPKQRPAVIFECVGVPGVIEQVIEGAPSGERIVVVGVCMETDRIEPFFRSLLNQ